VASLSIGCFCRQPQSRGAQAKSTPRDSQQGSGAGWLRQNLTSQPTSTEALTFLAKNQQPSDAMPMGKQQTPPLEQPISFRTFQRQQTQSQQPMTSSTRIRKQEQVWHQFKKTSVGLEFVERMCQLTSVKLMERMCYLTVLKTKNHPPPCGASSRIRNHVQRSKSHNAARRIHFLVRKCLGLFASKKGGRQVGPRGTQAPKGCLNDALCCLRFSCCLQWHQTV